MLGLATDPELLARLTGYRKLRVRDLSPETGFHVRAHVEYWEHAAVAQQLVALARLGD